MVWAPWLRNDCLVFTQPRFSDLFLWLLGVVLQEAIDLQEYGKQFREEIQPLQLISDFFGSQRHELVGMGQTHASLPFYNHFMTPLPRLCQTSKMTAWRRLFRKVSKVWIRIYAVVNLDGSSGSTENGKKRKIRKFKLGLPQGSS